jgi:hypothetical protein
MGGAISLTKDIYGGILGGKAKEPEIKLPAQPKDEDAAAAKRRAARRRRLQALSARGYQGTILTSPSGALSAPSGGKTMLGQ